MSNDANAEGYEPNPYEEAEVATHNLVDEVAELNEEISSLTGLLAQRDQQIEKLRAELGETQNRVAQYERFELPRSHREGHFIDAYMSVDEEPAFAPLNGLEPPRDWGRSSDAGTWWDSSLSRAVFLEFERLTPETFVEHYPDVEGITVRFNDDDNVYHRVWNDLDEFVAFDAEKGAWGCYIESPVEGYDGGVWSWADTFRGVHYELAKLEKSCYITMTVPHRFDDDDAMYLGQQEVDKVMTVMPLKEACARFPEYFEGAELPDADEGVRYRRWCGCDEFLFKTDDPDLEHGWYAMIVKPESTETIGPSERIEGAYVSLCDMELDEYSLVVSVQRQIMIEDGKSPVADRSAAELSEAELSYINKQERAAEALGDASPEELRARCMALEEKLDEANRTIESLEERLDATGRRDARGDEGRARTQEVPVFLRKSESPAQSERVFRTQAKAVSADRARIAAVRAPSARVQ